MSEQDLWDSAKQEAQAGDTWAAAREEAAKTPMRAAMESVGKSLAEAPHQFAGGLSLGLAGHEEPQTYLGRASRVAGEASTLSLLSMGALYRTYRGVIPGVDQALASGFIGKTQQAARNFTREMARHVEAHPVSTLFTEMFAGGMAGVGGESTRRKWPDSPYAIAAGEVMGGLAGGAMLGTLSAIRQNGAAALKELATTRAVMWSYRKLVKPKEVRARGRIERATPDPEGAAAAMDEPMLEIHGPAEPGKTMPRLTPAQKTGDKGLLALEKSVINSADELKYAADDQIIEMSEAIKMSLEQVGGDVPIESTRVYLDAAHEHLVGLVEARRIIAIRRAEERMAAVGPDVSRESANIIAREEMERALADSRAQESELYDLIPSGLGSPTHYSQRALKEFQKELGKAQQGDIPKVAINSLQNEKSPLFLGNAASIKDLRALQSKLREVDRVARSKKQYNKARIANELANAITDDLSRTPGTRDVQPLIDNAVSFSRTLHEKFDRGTVGGLLGRSVSGGEKVSKALTLESSLGRGPRARVAYQEMIKAVEDSPAGLAGAVEDYMKDQFLRTAFLHDTYQPGAARRFMASNQDLLKEFPDLRADLEKAMDARDAVTIMERRQKSLGSSLKNPRISKSAIFLHENPDVAFRRVEGNRNPRRIMSEVLSRVNKDVTGEAREGLKNAYVARLIKSSEIPFGADAKRYSGTSMENTLSSSPIAEMLFTPAEMKRIQEIVRTAKRIDMAVAAQPAGEGIIGDVPAKITNLLSRLLAARTGGKLGASSAGGSLQMAQIFTKEAAGRLERFVANPAERLLVDAVHDETLWKALLLDEAKAPHQSVEIATRRINAWVASVISDIGVIQDEYPDLPEF